ncbi:MAG: alpha/beta hydrolase [Tepidisphaeraceae bacterium]
MIIVAVLFCAGCTARTSLIATPNLDLGTQGREAFASVPRGQQAAEMTILYAADRAVRETTAVGPKYGADRSGSLTVGEAVVGFDPPLSWDELVNVSTSRERRGHQYVEVKSAAEFGQLAASLGQMEVRDGRYQLTPEVREEIARTQATLHKLLGQRLEGASRRDVYLFVHGFNNSFDDAILRLAQVWHFMARAGVPVAYTWPAGRGGALGYAYDRESGEFTVYHLKRFILAIASCPDVQRIHIIAHSRGTDVVVTALRELNIEFKARGLATREQLKLENLVLAAPDLDADVFEQRFAIEDLHLVAARTTVYLSKEDMTLAFSNWLFGGRRRLGNLTTDEFSPDARRKLAALKNFCLVDCRVSGYSTSHDYAFSHPAVLSDMIVLLRDSKSPGADNGRPLNLQSEGVWIIANDYLLPGSPATAPTSPAIGN